jgi:serine/threonine-protein kinase
MHWTSGQVVARRYELVELLGEGGMGAVWSANHTGTQRRVALKFLKGPADPVLVRRFLREGRAASAVSHPNVVAIHYVLHLEDDQLAMVMDLLEGESLARRLARSGPLPLEELASVMAAVVSAVAAVHAAGIVHRDLKPENIFLARRSDGTIRPMLLDFGICKLRRQSALIGERTELTKEGEVVGTPCYMAPEQMVSGKSVDGRADVWALGVILYECATGIRPFDGDNLAQVVYAIVSGPITPLARLAPHLPQQFSDLVSKMLQRASSQRTLSLREVSAALRGFMGPNAAVGPAVSLRYATWSDGLDSLQAPVSSQAQLRTTIERSSTDSNVARGLKLSARVTALAGLMLLTTSAIGALLVHGPTSGGTAMRATLSGSIAEQLPPSTMTDPVLLSAVRIDDAKASEALISSQNGRVNTLANRSTDALAARPKQSWPSRKQ